MKQKKILIILATAFLIIAFSARVDIVDQQIDIMAKSIPVNINSNKTVTVTMHDLKPTRTMKITENNMPIDKLLLKTYENQNYGNSSMPLSPMPSENSSSSSSDNNSDPFSFDTPNENNNQNWGWVANEVNNANNYNEITPMRKTSGGLFQNSESESSSGYDRQSFFDDTLYGSDKNNNFLDGYDMGRSSPKDSDASPYSPISW